MHISHVSPTSLLSVDFHINNNTQYSAVVIVIGKLWKSVETVLVLTEIL